MRSKKLCRISLTFSLFVLLCGQACALSCTDSSDCPRFQTCVASKCLGGADGLPCDADVDCLGECSLGFCTGLNLGDGFCTLFSTCDTNDTCAESEECVPGFEGLPCLFNSNCFGDCSDNNRCTAERCTRSATCPVNQACFQNECVFGLDGVPCDQNADCLGDCDDGICRTVCDSDRDCPEGRRCNRASDYCVLGEIGDSCTTDSNCVSDNCPSGTCRGTEPPRPNLGLIIGAIVGSVLFLIALGIAIYFISRHIIKKKRQQEPGITPQPSVQPVVPKDDPMEDIIPRLDSDNRALGGILPPVMTGIPSISRSPTTLSTSTGITAHVAPAETTTLHTSGSSSLPSAVHPGDGPMGLQG